MAKLKVAGTWVGVLDVELESWTLSMLKQEIASNSNLEPDSINLICRGRILKDSDGTEKKLNQLGIKNNAKILATRVSVDEGKSLKEELVAEEERSRRLARIKTAVYALSKGHEDDSFHLENFDFELEDQKGDAIKLGSENDQRAVMMGLMLHTTGKNLIRKGMYKDALEVLTMGEEALSLADPSLLELADNVPMLQIDIVWCYLLLRDISWLSVAGMRLEKARERIELCHGKDLSRIRLLHPGHQPEVAIYLRLELLEGVVAFHSGQFEKSRESLMSAQAKFLKLQIPDEALSAVMNMGFKETAAKRALVLFNSDIQSAVDFLVEGKAKKKQKKLEDDRLMEQKSYGKTPLDNAVDLQLLERLSLIGFEKDLAAEALRRNENDFQAALNELTDPETNSAIQDHIESRKRKREETIATAEELVAMGFEKSRVAAALKGGTSMEKALEILIAELEAKLKEIDDTHGPTHGPDCRCGVGSSSTPADEIERDLEMEDELANVIAREEPHSDLEVEVSKEGEIINEYLALLASSSYIKL